MRFLLFTMFALGCGGQAEVPPAPVPVAPAPAPEAAPPPTPDVIAAPPGPAKVGNAAAGEAIFTTNCVACHQKDGTGMGGMLAADFTKEKERLSRPDAEILHSIRNGITGKKGTMPGWGATLSEQEMADALAYIRKTFGEGG